MGQWAPEATFANFAFAFFISSSKIQTFSVSFWPKKKKKKRKEKQTVNESACGEALRVGRSVSDFDVNTTFLCSSVQHTFCSQAVKTLWQNSIIELLHTHYSSWISFITKESRCWRRDKVTGCLKFSFYSVVGPCCVDMTCGETSSTDCFFSDIILGANYKVDTVHSLRPASKRNML